LGIARDAEEAERTILVNGGPFFVGVPPEAPPLGYIPTDDDRYRAEQRGAIQPALRGGQDLISAGKPRSAV
jgi:hypothetical protein